MIPKLSANTHHMCSTGTKCFYLFLQMLNATFGGKVAKKEMREDGQFTIEIDTSSPLFR